SAEGRRRHSAAYDLAEGEQVRGPSFLTACEPPVAGVSGPETGEDFVEDEECTVVLGDAGQPGVKALARGDDTHVCGGSFGNHGRDVVAVLGEGSFDSCEVVVRQNKCLSGGGSRDAGR